VSSGSFLISLLLLGQGTEPKNSGSLAALPESDLAAHAQTEFAEGVRLRQAADKARPHFQAAATCLEELRRRGAHNPILFRDLGNAYLLAGDLPQAILSYHRGLHLAPADDALRQNLTQAREQVVYPPEGSLGRPGNERRPPWLPRLPSEWLVIAAFVFYSLAWLSLTRWWMTRRGRLLVGGLVAFLAAGVVTAALVVTVQQQETHPLVVIARDGVLLRRGDGLRFPLRYETPVNRGVEARLLFERGAWVQIELAGGEIGWVPRDYVLIDTPQVD
jgi:hypothetical protein